MKEKNILVIPDLHFPFHHKNTFDFLRDIKKKYNPYKVIQLGDLVDFYQFSRYEKTPNANDVDDELEKAKKNIKELHKIFPEMDITIGNHCVRIYKRVNSVNVPSYCVKRLEDILDLPQKYKLHTGLIINKIKFFHGFKSGDYAHVNTARAIRQSCVVAHTHTTLGIEYLPSENGNIFAVAAGCLIDKNSYAFVYSAESLKEKALGCAVIIDNKIPIVIPLK